jgi:hypothetical protein
MRTLGLTLMNENLPMRTLGLTLMNENTKLVAKSDPRMDPADMSRLMQTIYEFTGYAVLPCAAIADGVEYTEEGSYVYI